MAKAAGSYSFHASAINGGVNLSVRYGGVYDIIIYGKEEKNSR